MLQIIGFVVVVAFLAFLIIKFIGVSLWTLVGIVALVALAVYIYNHLNGNRNVY